MSSIAPLRLFPSNEAEQQWINEQTTVIPLEIMQAVIASNQQTSNGFKVLAEKHIKVTLDEDLEKLDQTIQNLYVELCKTSWEYIKQNSPPIMLTLGMINIQTQNELAGGQFLASFIHNAIMTLPAAKEHYLQRTQSSETWQELQPSDLANQSLPEESR